VCLQGQQNVKELSLHPQIPGMCITTAFDGINAFKPFNIGLSSDNNSNTP
jgi:ribosome assembly protein RRB1